jgi:hypothetical protein
VKNDITKTKSKAIAVVGNFKFLLKHLNSFLINLEKNGNYKGDVVILTNKFSPSWFIKKMVSYPKITIIKLPKIMFPKVTRRSFLSLDTSGQPNRFKYKNFQWFKIHLFNESMKHWKTILYLDINLTIHHDINGIFNLEPSKSLLAKADAYPEYNKKLASQFDNSHYLYETLENNYDLEDVNYFQTGLLYYDTSIIHKNMVQEIIDLAIQYPLSVTNEQGIINLLFQNDRYKYRQIPEIIDGRIFYYYWMIKDKKISITKQVVEKYK